MCPDGSTGSIILQNPSNFVVTSKEPINKRGWTLQERLLSPRVLVYGASGLYWECQTKHLCNGGQEIFDENSSRRLDQSVFDHEKLLYDPKAITLKSSWAHVIEDYSNRLLTVSEDKLTALSGITAEFARAFGKEDEHLAGLWKSWIAEGLTWFVTAPNGKSNAQMRPGKYRAPTWSWASTDSQVVFAFMRHYKGVLALSDFKILDCKVAPAAMGRVTSGVLFLEGRLQSATWTVDREKLMKEDGSYLSTEILPDAIESDSDYTTSEQVQCLQIRANCGIVLYEVDDGTFKHRGWYRAEIVEGNWFGGTELQQIKII